MRLLLACWRLGRSILHVLQGAMICALLFPFLAPPKRWPHVGRWSRGLLRTLGIELRLHGRMRPGPLLVVANHVSWLDILAINAAQPVRFVSKADVRRWPLLGWLVACGGTLFIERERKRDALRVVHQVAERLREGEVVAVFPEGTTSDGHDLLPFHGNLLQAAIVTETPLQPLALRYSDADEAVSQAAAYIGDTNLLQSIWAVVSARELAVDVRMLDIVNSVGAERRALAHDVRHRIADVLSQPLP